MNCKVHIHATTYVKQGGICLNVILAFREITLPFLPIEGTKIHCCGWTAVNEDMIFTDVTWDMKGYFCVRIEMTEDINDLNEGEDPNAPENSPEHWTAFFINEYIEQGWDVNNA